MATSTTISELTDIGANIAPSTIVPVVDMTGPLTTHKANLQIVGNLILNGAGGSSFAAAAKATTAGTVTTAAQPNITSVGELIGLAVNGTSSLGDISGVKITGGDSTNILTTDGLGNLSWVAGGSGSSFGNLMAVDTTIMPITNNNPVIIQTATGTPPNPLYWYSLYGDLGIELNHDYGEGVAYDLNGNIYVVGGEDNFGVASFLVKYSPTGVVLWQKTFDLAGDNKSGESVITDSTGNVYVGITDYTRNSIYLVKLTPAGVILWQNEIQVGRNVNAANLAVDSADNVYFVVLAYTPNSRTIFKFDSLGNEVFQVENEFGFGLGVTVDGAGNIYGNAPVTKYDSLGVEQYQLELPDFSNTYNVVSDTAGNLYVCGSDTFSSNGKVQKLDPTGSTIWSSTFDTEFAEVYGITLDPLNNAVLITGARWAVSDICIASLDATTGALNWCNGFGSAETEGQWYYYGTNFISTIGSLLSVTCYTSIGATPNFNVMTLQVATDGTGTNTVGGFSYYPITTTVTVTVGTTIPNTNVNAPGTFAVAPGTWTITDYTYTYVTTGLGVGTGSTYDFEFGLTGGLGFPDASIQTTALATGMDFSFGNLTMTGLTLTSPNVTIGLNAGVTTQGVDSIAIGNGAGQTTQGNSAVAMGWGAGATAQGIDAVAIGDDAGRTNQGQQAVAVGFLAGSSLQRLNGVAIGSSAGLSTQGVGAVAIGVNAGLTNQGFTSVAIGSDAGSSFQVTSAFVSFDHSSDGDFLTVADLTGITVGMVISGLGFTSGQTVTNISPGNTYFTISGPTDNWPIDPPVDTPLTFSTFQNSYAVAVGPGAGASGQGLAAVAIGSDAGRATQGGDTVAIGSEAAYANQTYGAVAIGRSAGRDNQSNWGVAVGSYAGTSNQLDQTVAVGGYAGSTTQGYGAVAIGFESALMKQGGNAVAIGLQAGFNSQSANAIAIGALAAGINNAREATTTFTSYTGTLFVASTIGIEVGMVIFGDGFTRGQYVTNVYSLTELGISQDPDGVPVAGVTSLLFTAGQGPGAIAIGYGAAGNIQGNGAIAIGFEASVNNQGINGITIGYKAGNTQGINSIAIGAYAADGTGGEGPGPQGANAIAIGAYAGQYAQNDYSVGIGFAAGSFSQGPNAVAIGSSAGSAYQGSNSVAIGSNAGTSRQGYSATAIGDSAGASEQAEYTVAIGANSGSTLQHYHAVAIGSDAGANNQWTYAIAIGSSAAANSQGANSVAIGTFAGNDQQGENAIAIGANAGVTSQTANSIILNATGAALDATVAGFHVKPVRNISTATALFYDSVTGEISYSSAGIGTSGYSGINGTSGYSGATAPSGYSGINGTSGYSGATAPSGYSGINGTPGTSGYSGVNGASILINSTADAATTTLYPVMVGATGSNQTAKSATSLVFNALTGALSPTAITVAQYTETMYAPAAGTSFTVDLTNGSIQRFTTSGSTTIALPAAVAGKSYVVMVEYGGADTIAFSGGTTLKWPSATQPTSTSVAGKVDIYSFMCDAAVTYGRSGGSDF